MNEVVVNEIYSHNPLIQAIFEQEKIIPTPCQVKAIEDVQAWLQTKDKVHVISGSAGRGKTFATKMIIKHLSKNFNVLVLGAAPTHKACYVFRRMSKVEVYTYHSFFGLRPNYDLDNFDIDNVQFDWNADTEKKIKDCDIAIFDECSMINAQLYEFIMNQLNAYNKRVIFVGDRQQLPPINEDISRVFLDANSITHMVTPARQKPTNSLTLPIECLINDIAPNETQFKRVLELCKLYGVSIEVQKSLMDNPKKTFSQLIQQVPSLVNDEGEGFTLYTDEPTFKEVMNDNFKSIEIENMDDCRFLAWTGKRATEINSLIRNTLIFSKEDLKIGARVNPILVVDDWLMCHNSIYNDKERVTTNSAEYIVRSIIESVSAVNVMDKFQRPHTVNLNTYQVMLESFTNKMDQPIIQIVHPSSYAEFMQLHSHYHGIALSTKMGSDWRAYYEFKNQHLIVGEFPKRTKYEKVPKFDFDYPYGLTVHKSQGSTYLNVFIDGRNIRSYYEIKMWLIEKEEKRKPTEEDKQKAVLMMFKLMYVALSRASKHAHILI